MKTITLIIFTFFLGQIMLPASADAGWFSKKKDVPEESAAESAATEATTVAAETAQKVIPAVKEDKEVAKKHAEELERQEKLKAAEAALKAEQEAEKAKKVLEEAKRRADEEAREQAEKARKAAAGKTEAAIPSAPSRY